MEVFDLSDKTERVLLVGVQENDGDDTEESLQELAELAKTAGAEVVGTVIQKEGTDSSWDLCRKRKNR